MIQNRNIDHGREFDWGRTSTDYARYRDIYPEEFYQKLLDLEICVSGQRVLDLGTGTGVLPRNLYRNGASFTGVDIAENQIREAESLSRKHNMDIQFMCAPAEKVDFPEQTFDIVTACQCFTYFNHEELAPRLSRLLKQDGRFAVLYMAWLPYEDEIAGKSEELILKFNPAWTGCGEKRHPVSVPKAYMPYFTVEKEELFDVCVPFTRESWNGRMKACRGVGASLGEKEIEDFQREHIKLLQKTASPEFEILHYAAITVLRKKREEY